MRVDTRLLYPEGSLRKPASTSGVHWIRRSEDEAQGAGLQSLGSRLRLVTSAITGDTGDTGDTGSIPAPSAHLDNCTNCLLCHSEDGKEDGVHQVWAGDWPPRTWAVLPCSK